MSLRALLSIGFLLAGTLVAPQALAATSCYFIGTDPGFAFGTVAGNPTVASDANTTATVRCVSDSGPTNAKVCLKLSAGAPDATLLPQRRMTNGALRLNFQAFRDSARTQVHGDGGSSTPIEAVINADNWFFGYYYRDVAIPMYGRLQGGQSGIAAGAYSSAMTLNLTGSLTTNASCNSLNNVVDSLSVAATATVVAACTLATNPLSFGTVNVLTANVDSTTSLGLNCTNGAPWTLRMNGGTVANSVTARRMGLGGVAPGVINYQLRHTSAAGPLWGDGTAGTAVLTGTGSGSSQTVTVYGRIPGGQPPPPVGTYSDVVTVSVEY